MSPSLLDSAWAGPSFQWRPYRDCLARARPPSCRHPREERFARAGPL